MGKCGEHSFFKGEVRQFFYWLKVFIGPKLRQVSKGNFHRKAPKWVKNQTKGSKIHKIRTKWHPTYCGNPSICKEWIPTAARRPELMDSHSRLVAEFVKSGFPQKLRGQNWWISTVGRWTELMDFHSKSDAIWSLFCEFWTLWPDF